MARRSSKEKMGYYRLPPAVVPLLASSLHWNEVNHLCDPFSGCGQALKELAEASGKQCVTWGNELNKERFIQSKAALSHTIFGPAEYCELADPQDGFPLCLYNPDYDTIGGDRLEIGFLPVAARLLRPGGILLAVIPEGVATNYLWLSDLLKDFIHIGTRRIPEPEYSRFKQVIVFAARRTEKGRSFEAFELEKVLQKGVPTLTAGEFQLLMPEAQAPSLKSTLPVAAEALQALDENTVLNGELWQTITVPVEDVDFRPLAELQPGHAALLLAAGMVDGVDLNGWLLKGYSYRYLVTQEIERKDESGREYVEYLHAERIAHVIAALCRETGELKCYDSRENQEEYEAFLSENIQELMRQVNRRYRPLFDGDISKFEPIFARIHPPGILPGQTGETIPEPQKYTAAALATLFLSGSKGGWLEGDMGVGKTFISMTVKALITTAAATTAASNASKVVVVAPDHLVRKWKREIETSMREFDAEAIICKTVLDVDRAFSRKGMTFLILGQQDAKNGSLWEPAYNIKKCLVTIEKVRRERTQVYPYYQDVPYTVKEILEIPICPTCGADIPASELLEERKGKLSYKHRLSCYRCGNALWTDVPFKKGGRYPLARYINRRYSGRYFFILDEAHESAAGSSNIGHATRWLSAAATHSLFMTGTLSNGKASSLFHLAHRCLPSFRDLYDWDGVNQFVDHYGLRQVISDTRLRYESSTFGYKRLIGGRSTEIAGIAPGIVSLLLPYTVFLYIEDLATHLSDYKEYQLAVEAPPNDPAWKAYNKVIMGELKEKAGSLAARKENSLLAAWLQAALGYLDCPEMEDHFSANGYSLTVPAVTGHAPVKDDRVIELVQAEIAADRNCWLFFPQVNRRDAMSRVAGKLSALGIPTAVLRRSDDYSTLPDGTQVKVKNQEREGFIEKAVKAGARAVLSSPELVKTGLDLVAFPTLVFFGVIYSLYTLRQASRRSWRLSQNQNVKVIYAYWQGSFQQAALAKVAAKVRAAGLVDGRSVSGLGAMEDDSGFLGDLIAKATGNEKPELPDYTPPDPVGHIPAGRKGRIKSSIIPQGAQTEQAAPRL